MATPSQASLGCLQTTARRNSIPIDSLSFEYSVVNIDERELQQPPKEGVYIKVTCLLLWHHVGNHTEIAEITAHSYLSSWYTCHDIIQYLIPLSSSQTATIRP